MIITIMYILCVLLSGWMGASVLVSDSKNAQNRIFFLFCINLACWAFFLALMNNSFTAETAVNFRIIAAFFCSIIYPIFLHFIIITTNLKRILTGKLLPIIYTPAIISIYLYCFQPVGKKDMIKTVLGWVCLFPNDRDLLWEYYYTVFFSVYCIIYIVLLIHWYVSVKRKREKRQAKNLIFSILFAFILGAFTDVALPMLNIIAFPPLTVIFMQLSIFVTWYSRSKYKFMNLKPEAIMIEVFKTMEEGLLIANSERIIVEANKGALELLNCPKNQVIGQPLSSLFSDDMIVSYTSDFNGIETEIRSDDSKNIPILLSSSTCYDEFNEPLGRVVTFQNITEMQRIKNQLKKNNDELEMRVIERTSKLNDTNEVLKKTIEKRIEMEAEIKKMALYDQMTGLPNKSLFLNCLKRAISDVTLRGELVAVFILDLDSFKRVNDTIGYAQANKFIIEAGNRLKKIIKKNDTLARTGGDEFSILANRLKDIDEVEQIGNLILEAFIKPFRINGYEFHITASIGCAVYPFDGDDVQQLTLNSGNAMYLAKQKGKKTLQYCTSEMKIKMNEELELTNYLYLALKNNEFELYYQPQVDASSGEIVSMEALIRWNNPQLGKVSPNRFIRIAEKTGLIISIGAWALQTACLQCKAWQDSSLKIKKVSINLSMQQFEDGNIVELVKQVLHDTELPSEYLGIEVTESIAMKEADDIVNIMNQFKTLGISISIDDFGVDYSSLRYLKKLPVDFIKIDKEFISGVDINTKDEAVIKAIISLARELGMTVVAEGVETKNQLDFLVREGCNIIQGYYYYKPMPPQYISKLLKM